MLVDNVELKKIVGGGSTISAAMISSVVRGMNLFLELGRSIGTAIKRVSTGKTC